MANRLQNVLTSIFLPRDSIYADIDNPEEGEDIDMNADIESPPLSSVSPQSLPAIDRNIEEVFSEPDDPFALSPPGNLSPVEPRFMKLSPEFHPPPPPPLLPTLSRNSSSNLIDSKSPFHDIPSQSTFYLQSNSNASSSRSPTRSMMRGKKSSSGNMSNSSSSTSAIGNRSLMGLLGGTRYGIGGFEGIELDREVVEEEDEDSENGRGRNHRGRDLSRSEQELAASLPPPPSAISPTNYNSSDGGGEEEDDLRPPDFISQATSSPSSSTRKSRRLSNTSTSTRPDWTGLHLGGGGILGGNGRGVVGMGAKERALWRWVNVEDLDAFLQEVYVYYVGKGIWAIGLSRLLNLLTVGWVIFFSTFLLGCIDYSVLWTSHHLSEVVVPSCVSRFSGLTFGLFLAFTSFYLWRIIRFGLGVRKLWEMHEFYAELLEVPENDIQTIPWHVLVSQLSILRASHPSALSLARTSGGTSTRLDAHDVANRIMREENYLIALFNKDVLDITIPIPEIITKIFPSANNWGGGMLTRTLEWNLSFCLTGFLFGRDGQVRRAFVSERNKKELTEALQRRFVLMGLINAVFAPFIVLYLLMYSFFRYFEEYHKNPSSIGSRQFTQLARWKFREFNELPHSFQQRINRAHPLSEQYVNQFPKEKTALVSRFIAFLAGSFAAVLLLFSLIDPDAFLHFEITPGRTVLFYITVFGVILAVARGMVPDENRVVDPEELMKKIVEHTHYLPVEWRGKLHSAEVHVSFGQLFQMKIAQFVQELLSVVVTPFVLWYTLPNCAGAIVDFFREFTVHVDGLGYVCSFAVFDFKRHGDIRFGAPVQVEDDRWKSKEGKMEKSFLGFTLENPTWKPRDQTQSLFLSKMTEASPSLHPNSNTSRFPIHHNGSSNFTSARSVTNNRTNRYNFGNPTLGEEPNNDRVNHKSSLGNKSILSKRVNTGFPLARVEQVIDEESGLDGDSYVATTETRPFGNEEEEIEVDSREERTERTERKNSGLAGLLGEVYESKKW